MSVLQKQVVRHMTMIKAGLVATLAVLGLLMVILPLFSRIGGLNTKIASREKESKDIANKVAVLSGLDKEILTQRVEILDKALPPKKDVLLYLSAIDGLSRELGLNFKGISLAPGEVSDATSSASTNRKTKIVRDEVPGVHSLETDIKITGPKDSIFAFLRTIEQSLPLMQVKDVKVSATGDDSYTLSLRLGMLWASGNLANVKGAITLFNEKEEAYFQQLASYKVYVPSVATEQTNGTGPSKTDLFAPALINQVEVVETPEASESAPTSQQ